jgi:hypothetical protein
MAKITIPSSSVALVDKNTGFIEKSWFRFLANLGGAVNFSSPPPIGDVTPNTGEFTSLGIAGALSPAIVASISTPQLYVIPAASLTVGAINNQTDISYSSIAASYDVGATRSVIKHLGPADAVNTLSMRALEGQTIRLAGTMGTTWAMELGVHSEVAGVFGGGPAGNYIIGAYIACSHAGWAPTGVRGDYGILLTGADGWYHPITCTDTDGTTVMFDVSGGANVGIGTGVYGNNAARVLGLGNASAPTTSPAGMGQLYVEAGALKFRGSAGTITVLAPA